MIQMTVLATFSASSVMVLRQYLDALEPEFLVKTTAMTSAVAKLLTFVTSGMMDLPPRYSLLASVKVIAMTTMIVLEIFFASNVMDLKQSQVVLDLVLLVRTTAMIFVGTKWKTFVSLGMKDLPLRYFHLECVKEIVTMILIAKSVFRVFNVSVLKLSQVAPELVKVERTTAMILPLPAYALVGVLVIHNLGLSNAAG